jgi:hypothetical protein
MGEPADRWIAALAKKQHGYATRQQLLRLGLGRGAIRRRIAGGRLIPVYAGVYAVGHTPTHPLERAHGALLACGPGAVLSHGSAGVVWGLFKEWRMPFEVTVPGRRRRPEITIHSAKLIRPDWTTNLGIRVTSPARTVMDMTPRLSDKALARAVNELRLSHHLRLEQLAELLERYPRCSGARRLRRFIDEPRGPTRSEFEVAFQALVDRYDLPEPLFNATIAGVEPDVYFPDHRLIVELDGWNFHCSLESFISDRERDAKMLALGIPSVRITWERLTGAEKKEASRLRTILEQRGRVAA